MLLAIDVGNTNIVLGVFDGDTLVESWRLATDNKRSADEYGTIIDSMFMRAGHSSLGYRGHHHCIGSSVTALYS